MFANSNKVDIYGFARLVADYSERSEHVVVYCGRGLAGSGGTHFSLSRREGQRAGRILPAQSSSENISGVAASAKSAALRAWTNGSRRERVKAATRTFVRVYSTIIRLMGTSSGYVNLNDAYICAKMLC